MKTLNIINVLIEKAESEHERRIDEEEVIYADRAVNIIESIIYDNDEE